MRSSALADHKCAGVAEGGILMDVAGALPVQESFRDRCVQLSAICLFAALVFVPFQQGLTIDVGFPLKISEPLAIVGILLAIIGHPTRLFAGRGAWIVGALLGVTLISSIWNGIVTDLAFINDAYPRGLIFDLAQYTAYAILALVFALALSAMLKPADVLSAFGWAVRLVVIYCLIQLVAWFVFSSPLEIIGGNVQLGSQYGMKMPRNGPLREGNYLGLFAVVSVFLLVRARDAIGVACAVALIIYSQSTGALVGLCVGIVAGIILRPTWRKAILLAVCVVMASGVVALVPALRRVAVGQLTKLGLIPNTLGDSYAYSLRSRSVNAETGFRMIGENPVLGVGQGRYAYHYESYLDRTGLPTNFGATYVRPIANNVYAQIAAETGVVALILFIALLVALLIRLRRSSSALVGAASAICVGAIAFPAWTNLMLWAAIAACMTCAVPSGNNHGCADELATTRRARNRAERSRQWSVEIAPGYRPVT